MYVPVLSSLYTYVYVCSYIQLLNYVYIQVHNTLAVKSSKPVSLATSQGAEVKSKWVALTEIKF